MCKQEISITPFRRIQSILSQFNKQEKGKENRVTEKALLGVLLRLAKELRRAGVLKSVGSRLGEDIIPFLCVICGIHSYSEQRVTHHLSLSHNNPLLRIKVE